MTRAHCRAIFMTGLIIRCVAPFPSVWAQSTADSRVENGIHVGAPKIGNCRSSPRRWIKKTLNSAHLKSNF
jgi:hypothetical protein